MPRGPVHVPTPVVVEPLNCAPSGFAEALAEIVALVEARPELYDQPIGGVLRALGYPRPSGKKDVAG